MNRVIVPLGVGLAALAVWLIVGQDDPAPSPPPPSTTPDATAVAPKTSLPSIRIADAPRDAAVPDGALTLKQVRRKGLTGRPAEWVDDMMLEYQWRAVDGEPNTWEGGNNLRVTYVLDGDRVTGIQAKFPPTAMSPDVKLLSGFVVGEHDAIPLHMETDDPPKGPQMGEFELEDGRKFYYRAVYRTEGEPPFSARELEVSTRPL